MSTEKIDFGRLFELYAEDVRSALRRYGGPQMFVEDGLQEVFEIALRDYRATSPPRPWLLKTAFHVAQNWRRMAQRAREVAGVGVDSVDEISPEHWFTVTETRVRVHSVINTLDEDLRQVFIMAEIEDIPLAEIAATLDVPLSTIKSRVHRARNAFFAEGHRRRAAGVLGVLAILHERGERGLRANASRFLRNAGWAFVGGGVVAAWLYLTREPAPAPIRAEPAVVAETRWIALPAPPVLDPPHASAGDLVPAASLTQPSAADPDEAVRDELTLIDTASLAIKQGRYREALQHLERHKHKYPRGTMSMVRDDMIRQVTRLIAG